MLLIRGHAETAPVTDDTTRVLAHFIVRWTMLAKSSRALCGEYPLTPQRG